MTPPFVEPEQIRRQAEGHGYPRGVDYFRQGAVRRIVWDEANGILTGTVAGRRSASYRATIRIDSGRAAGAIVWTDCTCPMQSACKHTVATLLAANAQALRSVDPPATAPRPAGVVRAQAERPGSSWRDLSTRPGDPTGSELALGVELRVRPARGGSSWTPRRVETASPRLLATTTGDVLVGLRPLVRSDATGNWIRGTATWDALRRAGLGFRSDHVRWLLDLYSIARDDRSLGPFADASDWITLDAVASELLWPHLATAGAHGVAIVSAAKGQSVRLADGAEASVVVGTAPEGGLHLRAEVRVEGLPVDRQRVRPVARSGVYAWDAHRDTVSVTLAPVALSAALVTLLTVPDGMPVPAADVDEFLRTAYPRIARGTAVVASAGVELPERQPPVLELTVRFRPREVVEYVFEWVYPDGGRHPFAGTAADRDPDDEEPIRARLRAVWAGAGVVPFEPAGQLADVEAAEFVARTVAALEDVDGIRVVVKGRRRTYRELTGDPEIAVSTVESADPDWFDLGVMVTIEGRTIPFRPLFTALATGKTKLLLVDGTYFSLAHPALARLHELIDEAAELAEWETGPRISRYQTTLWEDFEDLADVAEPAVSWRAAADGLRDVARIESTAAPHGLRAELRPYQQAGLDWLAFLWGHRLGGILADDMGLGKTLQMLAFLAHAREHGERRPFLVVAPTSVLPTWRDEASRFVPGLRVAVIEATRSRRGADLPVDTDVIVTSYTLLRLDDGEFADVEWAGVVLDEAQFAKNPATKVHKAIKRLRADVTFALTGTPLENTLAELWALLSLSAPGLFPSARRFRQDYIGPIEQGKVPENQEGAPYRAARLERLRRRVRPLMLRRTKEAVAGDLPPKQEQILPVELTPAHRALYDTVLQRERQKVLGLLEDLDRNRFIVFRSLTLLRMLSLSPSLIDPADVRIPSAKLDVLVDQVTELAAEGHRTLVFSQFTSFLQQAQDRLDAAGLRCEYLDGSTRRRADTIASFREGEAPVFLISLKAGGFGLTLTEADYVFLLDPWWNPAAEAQAVDRTHRIGQTRSVFVYRLIATGTIEEKVLALQQRKARLFRSVMDDDDLFARALTADDIRALFAA